MGNRAITPDAIGPQAADKTLVTRHLISLSPEHFGSFRSVAALAAGVTHDHPEGIKGAESTVAAIFLARTGHSKAEIKEYVEQEFGYDLSRTLDEIRPGYRFDESCQGTVPQAIIAFLESTGFEDAIRNAISLGGDSDTLAAITGSIAEAAYGVPQWIQDKAWEYLDEPLRDVLGRWREELFRRAKAACGDCKSPCGKTGIYCL